MWSSKTLSVLWSAQGSSGAFPSLTRVPHLFVPKQPSITACVLDLGPSLTSTLHHELRGMGPLYLGFQLLAQCLYMAMLSNSLSNRRMSEWIESEFNFKQG